MCGKHPLLFIYLQIFNCLKHLLKKMSFLHCSAFQRGKRHLTFAVANDMPGFILHILLCIDYRSFPFYSLKSLFWFCLHWVSVVVYGLGLVVESRGSSVGVVRGILVAVEHEL